MVLSLRTNHILNDFPKIKLLFGGFPNEMIWQLGRNHLRLTYMNKKAKKQKQNEYLLLNLH